MRRPRHESPQRHLVAPQHEEAHLLERLPPADREPFLRSPRTLYEVSRGGTGR